MEETGERSRADLTNSLRERTTLRGSNLSSVTSTSGLASSSSRAFLLLILPQSDVRTITEGVSQAVWCASGFAPPRGGIFSRLLYLVKIKMQQVNERGERASSRWVFQGRKRRVRLQIRARGDLEGGEGLAGRGTGRGVMFVQEEGEQGK